MYLFILVHQWEDLLPRRGESTSPGSRFLPKGGRTSNPIKDIIQTAAPIKEIETGNGSTC